MSRIPFATIELLQRVRAVVARYQDLVVNVVNPYRPELYYMRGPGPKWRAKQQLRHRNP
ncbi:hypothetical protein [Bradyrhizobium sp. NP1]|uniref:hypothetical protein n=1 Tax=Bradyrhizobium sp. NP1 TaxID=3049772 RepID=UPI0025A4D703|nr:hypothetical protein [Bradyrhizobium sp. NP1]WJR82084.1 hypothetical protein QOU61_20555 [Bradyrhizobium sp. NP1]